MNSSSNRSYILFLTACISPNGMQFTYLQDDEIRKEQYRNALKWYLTNTNFKIVFIENSLHDISHDYLDYIAQGRLEMMTFDGNKYDRSLGKGYGEAQIIQYGLHHSKILNKDDIIIKITGRLIVNNINRLVTKAKKLDMSNIIVNTDLCGNRMFAHSKLFIASQTFLNNYFLINANRLNDSKHYYFEHLLYDCMIEYGKDKHSEFSLPIRLSGMSGSTGQIYGHKRFTTVKALIKFWMHKCGIYRLL